MNASQFNSAQNPISGHKYARPSLSELHSTGTMSSHRGYARYHRGTTTRQTVRFAGRCIETTVTNDADDADAWVRSVLSHNGTPVTVGLDCEWRPTFVSGQPENRVAVLQLCVGDSCLILQLAHMPGGVPDGVKAFLEGHHATFVGVGVEKDVAKLMAGYGINCRNHRDLEEPCNAYLERMYRFLGFGSRRLGLKGYANEVLGIEMEKPRRVSTSDWEARTLSEEQIQYASIDAYVSYALGVHVRNYMF